MAQPPPYERAFGFAGFQAANPSSPLPGDRVDGEYDALEVTLDGVLGSLVLIQRDDGALVNGLVTLDTLAQDVVSLLAANGVLRGEWATGIGYNQRDLVDVDGSGWLCAIAHVSGDFADDVTLGRWLLVGGQPQLDFGAVSPLNPLTQRWNERPDGRYDLTGQVDIVASGTVTVTLPALFSGATTYRVHVAVRSIDAGTHGAVYWLDDGASLAGVFKIRNEATNGVRAMYLVTDLVPDT